MNFRKWILFGLALAMIAGTGALVFRLKGWQKIEEPGVKISPVQILDEEGKIAAPQCVALPELAGIDSKPGGISKIELAELPKDTTFGRRLYRAADGFQVQASVVLMGTDRTSIHQPQFCLTGQGWGIDRTEDVILRFQRPFPHQFTAKKLTASLALRTPQAEGQMLHGYYVYWFVAKDKLTAEQGERLWSMGKSLVQRGVLERWAYVSYFCTFQPGKEEETFARLQKLMADTVPEFQLATGKRGG